MTKSVLKYVATLTMVLSIGMAVQRGNYIYAYDNQGKQLWCYAGGELAGYTSKAVSVRKGNYIYMFDDHLRTINVIYSK